MNATLTEVLSGAHARTMHVWTRRLVALGMPAPDVLKFVGETAAIGARHLLTDEARREWVEWHREQAPGWVETPLVLEN